MTRRKLPEPRWQTPLPAGVVDSWGPDVAAVARAVLGIELDRWQRRAINRALATDADGKLVHTVYLISTGRQNGKTALIRALLGWALTARAMPEWSMILGLAHDRRQAGIPYRAVLADLAPLARRLGPASRGGLNLTRYLGIRSGMYGRHREYHTFSREARDAIRGESSDLVIFDECRTQRDFDTWAAVEPTTTARPDPLIVPISTAGDDRSVLLRSWWERGLRIIDGAEPMGGFGMTWYAAPDELAPDDPRAWRAANPALAEGRLSAGVILESFRTLPSGQFRAERLNLWADALDEWLPSGLWATLTAPTPEEAPRVILAAEAAPSWRRASVVAAIATGEGAWVGVVEELVAERLGRATIAPEELVELVDAAAKRWRPAAIAYSSTSAAGPHLASWADRRDLRSRALTPRDLKSASELFRAELVGGRVTHAPDPLLATQIRAARPSAPIEGGDWYLSVRQSLGDVDAARAAAWAVWALLAPDDDRGPQIFLG